MQNPKRQQVLSDHIWNVRCSEVSWLPGPRIRAMAWIVYHDWNDWRRAGDCAGIGSRRRYSCDACRSKMFRRLWKDIWI